MRRKIPIAESEPGRRTVARQCVHDLPALTSEPPPSLEVGCTREGVGDRVEIRTDVKTVDDLVITGVGDDHDLARIDDLDHAAEKARGTDAPCEDDDHRVTAPLLERRCSTTLRTPASSDVHGLHPRWIAARVQSSADRRVSKVRRAA